jgi:uncharacterized membrane protein YkgB
MYEQVSAARPLSSPRGLVLIAQRAARRLDHYALHLVRITIGIVFLWFGVLKLFPMTSPAEELAQRTLGVLTFGIVSPRTSLVCLATFECTIGLLFLRGAYCGLALPLLLAHLLGTATPLIIFPHEAFTHCPYVPTLIGQYIIKNLVIASAAIATRKAWRSFHNGNG